jgi:hypothetical protein
LGGRLVAGVGEERQGKGGGKVELRIFGFEVWMMGCRFSLSLSLSLLNDLGEK